MIAQDRPSWYANPSVFPYSSSRNYSIHQANVEGASRIARIAKECGVHRFVHVSSLLASPSSRSAVQRSKAESEQAVRSILPGAITVRPSSMFGHEDRLLNLIGLFSAVPLGYPVVRNGKAQRHPLYVGDFAEALLRLARAPSGQFDGHTFDLLGPEALTYHQLVRFFAKHTQREHHIRNLPPWAILAYSRLFPEWRRPALTMNLARELEEDEERTAGHRTFADLGITRLQTLEEQALPSIRGFRPVYAYPRPL